MENGIGPGRDEPSELSRRILPFKSPSVSKAAPPPMQDPDEVSTIVAPPPRSLLRQLARRVDDPETAPPPPGSVTIVGPGPVTMEQLASITRALRLGEARTEVLSMHGLTEVALVATMLVWKERLRRNRALWERFRDLVEGPAVE